MRAILSILILFVICIAGAGAETKIPVKLVKIKDGDTVNVQIDKNIFPVRLIGIDCLEVRKIHRAYRQAYENNLAIGDVVKKGKQSKVYFEKLYEKNKNKQTYIDFKGVDHYGRALGIIYFDSLNVNNDLLKNGGCLLYDYK